MLDVTVVTYIGTVDSDYIGASTTKAVYDTLIGTCLIKGLGTTPTYVIIPDGGTNNDLSCYVSGATSTSDLAVFDMGATTDEVYFGPLPSYKFKIDFTAETCDIMWPN